MHCKLLLCYLAEICLFPEPSQLLGRLFSLSFPPLLISGLSYKEMGPHESQLWTDRAPNSPEVMGVERRWLLRGSFS